jgi:hypothetical protein
MDWPFTLFAAEQGVLGLVLLGATLLALIFAANPNRKFVACSPGLFALLAFCASIVLAGIPGIEHSTAAEYVPFVGLLITLALFVPSTLALRSRWLGVLHLLTAAATLYLAFVAGMAISHDAT